MGRFKRLRRIVKFVFVVALPIWVLVVLALLAAIYHYGSVDYAQTADVIIVLGAGLRPDGTPTPTLETRSRHAATLWQAGFAPQLICTGGVTGDATISEAAACKTVLMAYGVPEAAILLEDQSKSTEENALFAKQIMDVHGWRSAVVVSSAYHLFRANWLFNGVGIIIYTSPAPVSLTFAEHALAIAREIGALHWQAFKTLLGLPVTNVTIT